MIDLRYSRRMDINHRYLTGDSFSLMDSAGKAVAEYVLTNYHGKQRVLIVCGPGNNGGDGFVAGSYLESKADVTVLPLVSTEMYSGDARKAMLRYTGRISATDSIVDEIDRTDLILDCIFGTGIGKEPSGIYREAIELINASGKETVSVDVPSGLGRATVIKPHCTITFHDFKEGMSEENCGQIHVVRLNYHEKSENYSGPGEFAYFPYPSRSSHKGMNGTVALVSGWEFHGSAVMAAESAGKAGADLVKIYSNGTDGDSIPFLHPSIIVRKIGSIEDPVKEIGKSGCVMVGSGMGRGKESMDFMEKTMKGTTGNLVIDADGIHLISEKPSLISGRKAVLTPHAGEFRDLTGMEPDEKNARKAAADLGAVLLLKGRVDIITDGTRVIQSEGGNQRLTMGGTGDMLAGIVASFMSKGMPPLWAASLASYVLKRSADSLFEEKSIWYDQQDLMNTIPGTLKWTESFCRQ
ncbi:MAG: NAD(P)H-hydrate dehydratase [Thermoplasmataceae archaeon]